MLGKKKTGKPLKKKTKKKVGPRIAKSEEAVAAEAAVKEYESLRDEISAEERLLEEEHPEAFEQIRKIDELKAQAQSAIAKAKGAVSTAKTTIGEFKYVPAFSNPSYTEDALMESLCSVTGDDGEPDYDAIGIIVHDLYQRGIIKAAKLDKKAAKLFHDQGGEAADLLENAWDPGGKELPGRVYTPKI